MGYTTTFSGAVALSRKLTISEAKELLEITEMSGDEAKQITGTRSYLQWVPTESLDQIVWDGGEKFYDYTELMKWLCCWLNERGIVANGKLFWGGEDADDTGVIEVLNNDVTERKNDQQATKAGRPLTMRALQAMALEQLTQ